MLKPSDLFPAASDYRVCLDIEEYIDSQLRSATAWPLEIQTPRSGWRAALVDQVLESYFGFWTIVRGRGEIMATFSPK